MTYVLLDLFAVTLFVLMVVNNWYIIMVSNKFIGHCTNRSLGIHRSLAQKKIIMKL